MQYIIKKILKQNAIIMLSLSYLMRVPLRVPLNDSGATASEHIKKKALALHTCM